MDNVWHVLSPGNGILGVHPPDGSHSILIRREHLQRTDKAREQNEQRDRGDGSRAAAPEFGEPQPSHHQSDERGDLMMAAQKRDTQKRSRKCCASKSVLAANGAEVKEKNQ